jgi:hypothetical protein
MLWRKPSANLAKVGVEGSNPFARSNLINGCEDHWHSQIGASYHIATAAPGLRSALNVGEATGDRRNWSGLRSRPVSARSGAPRLGLALEALRRVSVPCPFGPARLLADRAVGSSGFTK